MHTLPTTAALDHWEEVFRYIMEKVKRLKKTHMEQTKKTKRNSNLGRDKTQESQTGFC